jgi:hypothetical protein
MPRWEYKIADMSKLEKEVADLNQLGARVVMALLPHGRQRNRSVTDAGGQRRRGVVG